MSCFSESELSALMETATTAAAYLDACDGGAKFVRLDPTYYQACGKLLMNIFAVVDRDEAFKPLLAESAAARSAVESVEIERRLELSRLGYYPELSIVLNRAAV